MKGICGKPGPPWRKSRTGLHASRPRIEIHCGIPPNETASSRSDRGWRARDVLCGGGTLLLWRAIAIESSPATMNIAQFVADAYQLVQILRQRFGGQRIFSARIRGARSSARSLCRSWYEDDFKRAGGVKKVLARYAPEKYQSFLKGGDYEVDYLPYHWGLNDQGGKGKDYSKLDLYWDKITGAFKSSDDKKK